MGAPSGTPRPSNEGWTIERAEALLQTLAGVVSVRVVAQPGGDIQEIHLLTTEEVAPKQTVRNVESALLAHFDIPVDHRKISVAQSKDPPIPELNGGERMHLRALSPAPTAENRILFLNHRAETPTAHRVRMRVTVEWQGEQFVGDADAADLPRPRMEAVANATLRGIEAAVAGIGGDDPSFALALEGIRMLEAFERRYVLVAVTAMAGREMAHLSGTGRVGDSIGDKAVILATLQATDRWVRGQVKHLT